LNDTFSQEQWKQASSNNQNLGVPKQIDIVEKIRMSYEIISKKQNNKLLMSSTTGVHGIQSNNMTLAEDEHGEMED